MAAGDLGYRTAHIIKRYVWVVRHTDHPVFYWSIGSTLEQVWGTYRYNVYLLSGILFTIVGSFVAYGCAWTFYADKWGLNVASNAEVIFNAGSTCFSTYYITMSLFLAFAATFPNAQVLLMFFIPLKVKWLGVMYGVIILFEFSSPPLSISTRKRAR